MSQHIDAALGLDPIEEAEEVPANEALVVSAPVQLPAASTTKEFDPVVETYRQNYHDLYDKGKDALDEILKLSKSSQSARGYEVAATMIKTLIDVNKHAKDVYDEQTQDAAIEQKQEDGHVTQNNLFVGSTAELQQMLSTLKN